MLPLTISSFAAAGISRPMEAMKSTCTCSAWILSLKARRLSFSASMSASRRRSVSCTAAS